MSLNGYWPSLRAALVAVILGLTVVSTAVSAIVEPTRLAAVLDRLQKHYQQTESFSAKFSERLSGAGGNKSVRSGTVYYQKPGKMRWEFNAPQPEAVVSDGHMLYNYQPDLNQVLEVPISRAFKSAAPLAFLLGMGNLRRDFKASFAVSAPDDHLIHLLLMPKSGGDKVEIGLDPKSYDLMAVKVLDALGNLTEIHFSDVHANVALAQSLFRFEVPAGADVVQAPAAAPQYR